MTMTEKMEQKRLLVEWEKTTRREDHCDARGQKKGERGDPVPNTGVTGREGDGLSRSSIVDQCETGRVRDRGLECPVTNLCPSFTRSPLP